MPNLLTRSWSLIALLVFLLGSAASLFGSHASKLRIEEDARQHFAVTADRLTIKIEERLAALALVLRGGAAMFDAADDVTRDEWRRYVNKLQASDTVSGVTGFGFSEYITPDRLQAHIERVRAEGFPDYRIYPEGIRDAYSAIVYLEPFEGRNLRAFGYDMFSEPVRRRAMEQARDTGRAALTGRVQLVQETGQALQAGTLMYVPVYHKHALLDTVEQRRAALIGWSYSPYRMSDLLHGMLSGLEVSARSADTVLRIYDSMRPDPNALLFSSQDNVDITASSMFDQHRLIDFNGTQWLLEFHHLSPASALNYRDAHMLLATGLAISMLLSTLIWSLAGTRRRALALADRLTTDIQQRKQALKDSERRWRFAIEDAGDGLWDWDLQNDLLYFSPQWKTLLGYRQDEIGDSLEEWKSRIHPDDKDDTLQKLEAHLQGRTDSYIHEYRIRCSDNSWKWVQDRGTVLKRDEGGRPLRVIGTLSDISLRKTLEQERETLLLQFQTIASRVPGMVYEYRLYPDGHACFPYASNAIRQIYGIAPEAVIDDATPVLETLHPDDYDRVVESIQASARTLRPWHCEYRVRDKDGAVRWLFGDALPHADDDGVISWYGFITDITERKQAELALRESQAESERFRTALDYLTTIVFMKDTQHRYTYANRAALSYFNTNATQLHGSDDGRFFPPATVHQLQKIDDRVLGGEQTTEEISLTNLNGLTRTFLEIKAPIYKDEQRETIIGLMGISTDISHLKEHERQLEHMAHFDALTGLPNRTLLSDRLGQAMKQADRQGYHVAVVYLDLDGFKDINDNHGHATGDQILIAVARRMASTLRQEDTLSRIGGDEFVAILLDLRETSACIPTLTRLLDEVARPMTVDQTTFSVTASLGVSYYPQTESPDADQLLRQADQAMYQAKLAGKGRYHIFDAELDRSVRDYHEQLERIRQAMRDKEFTLLYQPKVNMRSGEIIGVEALLRWQHPEHGLLTPGNFLPVLESSPLMIELGDWVNESVLRQISHWQQRGLTMPVSINVSAAELLDDGFLDGWQSRLAAHPEIRPGMIELEVLETSALGDLAKIAPLLKQCRELGLSVALDDFGTGYSSLTYFKQLPAVVVKIDQSFVRDIPRETDGLAILDGIVALAKAFNRQVLAEGVETIAHGDMLLRIGCDLAQGYGIARPMPADQVPGWCEQWRPAPHWSTLQRLDRGRLPIIYASSQHRAWLANVLMPGTDSATSTVPLDADKCTLSQWLVGQAGHDSDVYPAIITLHHEVHALARQLDTARKANADPEQSKRLETRLQQANDSLLAQLDGLLSS